MLPLQWHEPCTAHARAWHSAFQLWARPTHQSSSWSRMCGAAPRLEAWRSESCVALMRMHPVEAARCQGAANPSASHPPLIMCRSCALLAHPHPLGCPAALRLGTKDRRALRVPGCDVRCPHKDRWCCLQAVTRLDTAVHAAIERVLARAKHNSLGAKSKKADHLDEYRAPAHGPFLMVSTGKPSEESLPWLEIPWST